MRSLADDAAMELMISFSRRNRDELLVMIKRETEVGLLHKENKMSLKINREEEETHVGKIE